MSLSGLPSAAVVDSALPDGDVSSTGNAVPGHRLCQWAALWIGVLHALLLARSAVLHSPVEDEVGHFVAGLAHWDSGRFDLYAVNPPLVRMLATLPVWLAGVTAPPSVPLPLEERQEFDLGEAFLRSRQSDFLWWYAVARWTVIPLSLVGAAVCYRWASELNGPPAGLAALSLWCFDPNILGNGPLVTTDVGATAVGAAAAYAFDRWLGGPTWGRSLVSGVLLGLAVLCKGTMLVLLALWPFLWLTLLLSSWPMRRIWLSGAGQLALMVVVAITMTHAFYVSPGSGIPSGDAAKSLPMAAPDRFAARGTVRQSALSLLESVLPEQYARGLAHQSLIFERGEWSYLRGDWRKGGWWYYYAYALLVKTPVSTLLLVLLAAFGLVMRRSCRAEPVRLAVLIAHLAVFFAMASVHTGININLRYVLPCYPFAFTLTAAILVRLAAGVPWRGALVACILAASALSSLRVYPHSLTYFNELAGGPSGGHRHLLHNNLDWGQDLLFLREWLRSRPDVPAIGVICPDAIDPQLVGIRSFLPYRGGAPREPLAQRTSGWYAVGANVLFADDPRLDWLRAATPAARVGHTIWIFHVGSTIAQESRLLPGPSQAPGLHEAAP